MYNRRANTRQAGGCYPEGDLTPRYMLLLRLEYSCRKESSFGIEEAGRVLMFPEDCTESICNPKLRCLMFVATSTEGKFRLTA